MYNTLKEEKMKKILLFLIGILLFAGCAQKVNVANLQIDPTLVKHEYNTYDIGDTKITSYYFTSKDGILHVKDAITYVPIDVDGYFDNPLSSFSIQLKSISSEKSLQKALEVEAAKKGYQKLFKDKNEYIIDNRFAHNIKRIIQDYNRRVEQSDDNDDTNEIVVP
jgi:hypothetical protein